MDKNSKYTKSLMGIFVCLGILVYGTLTFKQSERIDLNTLLYFFKTSLPYSVVLGFLGFRIGKIMDNPKPHNKKKSKES